MNTQCPEKFSMYITYAEYMYYLPWYTRWIKEVFVLTHVQGESLIHIGSIESNGGGNHSVREKNQLSYAWLALADLCILHDAFNFSCFSHGDLDIRKKDLD